MKKFFIILALLFFGCAATGSIPDGMTKEQVSTEQEAIKATIDQLATSWNEEDFKKWCSLWDYNNKFITREKTYRMSCKVRVKEEFQYRRLRNGTEKYDIKWVKLTSFTTATGFAECTCATCSKARGIAKFPVKFEFVKNNGQWMIKSYDTSR
jgi:hypothetical protein